jgi:hypothetical protein
MRPQLDVRAFLIGTHQPAVSSHVGRENRRKVAFNARLFQNLGSAYAEKI